MAKYEKRSAGGWLCEEPPAENFAGFFCSQSGLRVLVNVASEDPTSKKTGQAGFSTWNSAARRKR